MRAPGGIAKANAARTHCRNGHPYAGENLRVRSGQRICLACARAKWTRDNRAKSAALAPGRAAAWEQRTLDRFFDNLRAPSLLECWPWTGHIGEDGYGVFKRRKERKGAHRYAYEFAIGPIPPGLEIDHLCLVRHCVNPLHLEPVTHRENLLRSRNFAALNARKTHCKRGHEFTQENTYLWRDKTRICRMCARLRHKGELS